MCPSQQSTLHDQFTVELTVYDHELKTMQHHQQQCHCYSSYCLLSCFHSQAMPVCVCYCYSIYLYPLIISHCHQSQPSLLSYLYSNQHYFWSWYGYGHHYHYYQLCLVIIIIISWQLYLEVIGHFQRFHSRLLMISPDYFVIRMQFLSVLLQCATYF